jgi:hypothetical protein
MAVRSQEAELVKGGCVLRTPSDGQYVQNMLFENGVLEVRSGFGQVTQLDTTLAALKTGHASANGWGYRKHLGSYLVRTAFGHEQMMSVFVADVYASNLAKNVSGYKNTKSNFVSIYILSIYDLTTDSRWEEPLYRHTSTASGSTVAPQDVQFLQPHYATNADDDHQQWIHANSEKSFYFAELYDIVYFGNPDTGMMAYVPSTFRRTSVAEKYTGECHTYQLPRMMQLDTLANKEWSDPYGESATVIQAAATTGSENVDYLSDGNFPHVFTAIAFDESRGGFLVMVDKDRRTLWASEVQLPTAIPSSGFFNFPGDEPITAIAEQGGNLIIWTENTTWYLRLSDSFLPFGVGARLVKLSGSIGCAGQHVVVGGAGFGSVYWMDKRGCYASAGNMSIEKISAPIDPFFSDFVTNPLHVFFEEQLGSVTTGGGSTIRDQARTMLRFDEEGVSATYDAKRRLVIFSVPNSSTMLVWNEEVKQWTFWNTQSIATEESADGVIGATENIQNAWVQASPTNLYVVGGIDTVDSSVDSTAFRSYYILQYGRGGGVDRSVEEGEDQRLGVQNYVDKTPSGSVTTAKDTQFILGRPVPEPFGRSGMFRADGTKAESGKSTPIYWYPLYLSIRNYPDDFNSDAGSYYAYLRLEFTFDSTNWEPLFRVDAAFPTEGHRTELAWEPFAEHAAARSGWGYASQVHDGSTYHVGRKIACYSGTGVNDGSRTGNRIVMKFDPATAVSSYPAISTNEDWLFAPTLNASPGKLLRLCWLPFLKKTPDTPDVGCLGIAGQVAKAATAATKASADNAQFYAWETTYFGTSRRYDNTTKNAQTVDWLMKSDNVALKEDIRVHGRGTHTRLMSHGAAKNEYQISPNWAYGLYNTLSSADLKGWTSQVVDMRPDQAGGTMGEPSGSLSAVGVAATAADRINGLRSRFKDSSSARTRTFDNNLLYGNSGADSLTSIYLIDDEEVNEISVSDSVKGKSLSFMLFGHIKNKAEKLVVESVKALFRVLPAGRRRRGH